MTFGLCAFCAPRHGEGVFTNQRGEKKGGEWVHGKRQAWPAWPAKLAWTQEWDLSLTDLTGHSNSNMTLQELIHIISCYFIRWFCRTNLHGLRLVKWFLDYLVGCVRCAQIHSHPMGFDSYLSYPWNRCDKSHDTWPCGMRLHNAPQSGLRQFHIISPCDA